MSGIRELTQDFRAGCERETAILARLKQFFARYDAAAIGSEIAGEVGHVTASAWIIDPQNPAVLLVWSRKDGAWRLPGAHIETDGFQTAQNAAARALARDLGTKNPILWSLGEREIAEYWQTPAHLHFELIFRFIEPQTADLPRGAKWFSLEEVAELGDETLARLVAKQRCQP